ncbi:MULTISPECIES: hypothetical protein [unclassified Streptomyces]|uniref:hypothetical protein n=1 Tax=unclassified Streptomyces TaxID=2593676 RepID=UPI001647EE87|nr:MULTISPECIES: hypothetical protein [unclassified Streptomyces]
MTTERVPLPRTELADLLTGAAQSVADILTAEYPTAASRSYLHPVLGALAAGPRVVAELNDRLERMLADAPPANPAGLFTLASYASALGWLAESFAELTTAVDQICTRVGLPTDPPVPAARPDPVQQDDSFSFSALDLVAIRTAAKAADLTPNLYVEALSGSLLAASQITDACTEISNGLLEDATYLLDEAVDHVSLGDGPNSLPTLVRSLLARMEAAE